MPELGVEVRIKPRKSRFVEGCNNSLAVLVHVLAKREGGKGEGRTRDVLENAADVEDDGPERDVPSWRKEMLRRHVQIFELEV